jgi:hypothetical protein
MQPRWTVEMARYDAVFGEILGHSGDVPGDLKTLHLPQTLASSAGSTLVSANSAGSSPGYRAFLAHDKLGTIIGFYAHHPLRLAGLADRGLKGVSAVRPSYLGNYTAGYGRQPYGKECRVCVAESLFTLAGPERWLVFPVLWIGAAVLGLFVCRRARLALGRGAGALLAAFSLMIVSQFWSVLFFQGGTDNQHDMFAVVFSTILIGPLALAALAGLDQQQESVGAKIPRGSVIGAESAA